MAKKPTTKRPVPQEADAFDSFDFDSLLEGTGIPKGYRYTVLPTVSRDRALRNRYSNGRLDELAAANFPRTAHHRANQPRSVVTGITAGSNIVGAAHEDL